jgi:hypothetical protein
MDGFPSLIFIYRVFLLFVLQAGRCFPDTYKGKNPCKERQGGAFQILTKKKKNPCKEGLVKYKEKRSKYYFRFEKR